MDQYFAIIEIHYGTRSSSAMAQIIRAAHKYYN